MSTRSPPFFQTGTTLPSQYKACFTKEKSLWSYFPCLWKTSPGWRVWLRLEIPPLTVLPQTDKRFATATIQTSDLYPPWSAWKLSRWKTSIAVHELSKWEILVQNIRLSLLLLSSQLARRIFHRGRCTKTCLWTSKKKKRDGARDPESSLFVYSGNVISLIVSWSTIDCQDIKSFTVRDCPAKTYRWNVMMDHSLDIYRVAESNRILVYGQR